VTNSFEPISINAYKEIVYEIVENMGKSEPDASLDYIVVPCGSGDVIIGIWLALRELHLDTKIIAVAPQGEHPLRYALEQKDDQYTIKNYKE
jgi:threonine dehydratase